jgi:hypothetical protein
MTWPDVGDIYVFGLDTHLLGDLGMGVQHPVLAVERDEKFRVCESHHHLRLLVGVDGNMNVGIFVVKLIGARRNCSSMTRLNDFTLLGWRSGEIPDRPA